MKVSFFSPLKILPEPFKIFKKAPRLVLGAINAYDNSGF